ncbi:myosin [Acrasis kona]|uniref:Myosin n=1 Tax=Acrasis kona TaxID=1008807 RepID=A0AAW2ZJV9_9EUKA
MLENSLLGDSLQQLFDEYDLALFPCMQDVLTESEDSTDNFIHTDTFLEDVIDNYDSNTREIQQKCETDSNSKKRKLDGSDFEEIMDLSPSKRSKILPNEDSLYEYLDQAIL